MSTVFASQVDGWEDNGFDGGWNDEPEFRHVSNSVFSNANLEGYDGSPTHSVSIDDVPEMYFAQKRYEKYEQQNLHNNIETVKDCIKSGIMLPNETMMERIVEKLRKVAHQ